MNDIYFQQIEFSIQNIEQDDYSCIRYLVFSFCKKNALFDIFFIISFFILIVSLYISSTAVKSIFITNNRTIKFYLYFWLFSGLSFFILLFSIFINPNYYNYKFYFLNSGSSIARGIAQLIFDYLILCFLKEITNNKTVIGYYLIIITTIIIIICTICCILFDFIISDNFFTYNFVYVSFFLESLIQITSIYCFIRTFFISKAVALYLNPKSLFILKTLGVIYTFFLILCINFNVFAFDSYFYFHVNVHKPQLLKFFENVTVFAFSFFSIIQTLVSVLSVFILNLGIMDNTKEMDNQPSSSDDENLQNDDY